MDFDAILDQAIAILQRRGRLTYRALQYQFNLDDAGLEALKAELIDGQQVATDEGGKVLVWYGGRVAAAHSFGRQPDRKYLKGIRLGRAHGFFA